MLGARLGRGGRVSELWGDRVGEGRVGQDRTRGPWAEEGDLKRVLRVGQEPSGAECPPGEPQVTGVWEPPAGPPPRGEQTRPGRRSPRCTRVCWDLT